MQKINEATYEKFIFDDIDKILGIKVDFKKRQFQLNPISVTDPRGMRVIETNMISRTRKKVDLFCGRIDIFCIDTDQNYHIIEVKKYRESDSSMFQGALAQILTYNHFVIESGVDANKVFLHIAMDSGIEKAKKFCDFYKIPINLIPINPDYFTVMQHQ